AGVGLLERIVRRGHDVRPTVLGIHLEPDRKRIGVGPLPTRCGRRGDDPQRNRGGNHRENPVSHAKSPSSRRRARGASEKPVAEGRETPCGASSGLYQSATPEISHTGPLLSRGGCRAGYEGVSSETIW